MKIGDLKTARLKGKEHKCRLMSKHDLNKYDGWWYVNILDDNGLTMGVFIRNEKDLGGGGKE